jgi:enterochelin esterase-like enzyme
MTDSVYQRRIRRHRVTSSHLGETRTIIVSLPPGYTERRAYPVLYLQDGEDYFRLGRIATTVNRLLQEERIAPLLVVGIPVDKARRQEEYRPDGARFQQYQRFLLNEIIPYMDRVYATIPARRGRVIGGSSLGATQALMTAVTYPTAFRAVLSQSGAFHPRMHDWLRERGKKIDLTVYLAVGIHESPAMTPVGELDILGWNKTVADILQECGVDVTFHVKEGRHDWGFWQQDLPEALIALFPKDLA